MLQLTLSFQPGLTQEFKKLRAVTQSACIKAKGGVSGIAPTVDMSPSQLGRKLEGGPNDPHRSLDIDDFELVLDELVARGDFSPLYYLIEKYQVSTEQMSNAALAQLPGLLKRVEELVLIAEAPKAGHAKVRRR